MSSVAIIQLKNCVSSLPAQLDSEPVPIQLVCLTTHPLTASINSFLSYATSTLLEHYPYHMSGSNMKFKNMMVNVFNISNHIVAVQ